MKLTFILIIALLLYGCFDIFGAKKNFILVYKLSPNVKIEISAIGYGATTKDFTELRKVTANKKYLIKRIEGSYLGYKANILKINDTTFKLTFTDTNVFKGMNKVFTFNPNLIVRE
jgi:hypothetical protein